MAETVEGQVDLVIENCELPPDADLRLHTTLGPMPAEGGRDPGPDPRNGAMRMARALDAYGEHFDHERWKPLPRYAIDDPRAHTLGRGSAPNHAAAPMSTRRRSGLSA